MSTLTIANRDAIAEAMSDGFAHYKAGRLDQAEAAYRGVLAAQPDHADALVKLGNVLVKRERFDAASAAYRRAIELAPGVFAAHNNLGGALQKQRCYSEAVDAHQRAIELDPDHPGAHRNLGVAYKALGRFAEAASEFQRAIELDPNFAAAYQNLRDVRDGAASDVDVGAMETLLRSPSTSQDDRIRTHFALGAAHEELGDFDRAFDHFANGNALKAKAVNYRPENTERAIARAIDCFDGETLRRTAGAGYRSDVPVFVVGLPRSGTSLVEQILASHPDVFGAGELNYVERLVRGAPQRLDMEKGFPDYAADAGDDLWRLLGESYVAAVEEDAPAAARIVDKLPGNYQFLGAIRAMLPEARIIHCLRGPLDTCVSCFTTYFVRGQGFTYDLANLGAHYRLYGRLMDHWRSVLPGTILEVRYEDVVSDLEASARRMVDFCGLEWNPACLRFHETERPVATASATQVRRPIYTTSVGRWRRFEKHLRPLIDALGPDADV